MKMKSIFRFGTMLLLLGGWTLAAAALHVVNAPGRLIVVPKDHLSFDETYVDTRAWKIEDVSKHPAIVKRLLAREKADALQHVATDATGRKLVEKLREAVNEAPPATQTAALSIRFER